MSRNKLTSVIRRGILAITLSLCLFCSYGCSIPDLSSQSLPNFDLDIPLIGDFGDNLAEVSPPELIQSLKSKLVVSDPTVKILEPVNQDVVDQDDIAVKLSVSGLKLFKDAELKLGPHIALFLDDQDPIEVFDVNQPIHFDDLKPGTHTLRAIAEYPWHESFKNSTAYAQTSFDVFTASSANSVGKSPLLTTSSISKVYTAEPMLLDFLVRSADQENQTPATQVKATLNEQAFTIDEANASVYLTGLRTGKNWLKLELQDGKGRLASAPFSEQLFGFEFQPEETSSLGSLLSEKMTMQAAGGIVGIAKPAPKPSIAPTQAVPPAPPIKPSTQSPSQKTPASPSSASNLTRPVPLSSAKKTSLPQDQKQSDSSLKPVPSAPVRVSPSTAPTTLPSSSTPKVAPAPVSPSPSVSAPLKQTPTPISEKDKSPVNTEKIRKPLSSNSASTSPSKPLAPSFNQPSIDSSPIAPESKTEPVPVPSQTRPEARDLNTQMRSLRDDSKKQLTQGLKSWRDRFSQMKPETSPSASSSPKNGADSSKSSDSKSEKTTDDLIKQAPTKVIETKQE